MTTLQGHRRTPQPIVPSAALFHCCAEGKGSCSPRHHGKAIATELGVTVCMLLKRIDLSIYTLLIKIQCKLYTEFILNL